MQLATDVEKGGTYTPQAAAPGGHVPPPGQGKPPSGVPGNTSQNSEMGITRLTTKEEVWMHMVFTETQYKGVSAMLAVGVAAPGAVTIFLWLQLENLAVSQQAGPSITGIVTLISAFSAYELECSWDNAFLKNPNDGMWYVKDSGPPMADAKRYVDWVLTVPLLLIELIMVIDVPQGEKHSLMARLGIAAVLMICAGYPGELLDDNVKMRWLWFSVSMVPFLYIMFSLIIELGDATDRQPEEVRYWLVAARILTVISWLTYPGIYLGKCLGLQGPLAVCFEQMGYTMADILAKACFGMLIWLIARRQSEYADEMALIANQTKAAAAAAGALLNVTTTTLAP